MPATTTQPGLAPVGEASTVSLSIKVRPDTATVMLDGAPVSAPFSGQFRKDASLHHLEVSGPGLRSVKQLIAFDRDLALDIALEALPERASAQPARRTSKNDKSDRPVAQAPSAPPARVEEPAPAPAAAPAPVGFGEDLKTSRPRVSRGHIDSIDPYSTK
jgi:hypothetical protein